MDTAPAPGRLGNPDETLASDPRTDRRLAAMFDELGLGGRGDPLPLDASAPLAHLLEFCNAAEEGFSGVFDLVFGDTPPLEGVERSTQVIAGSDGNDVTLFIHRPTEVTGDVPAVLHLHGGGMTIMTAADPNYVRWRDTLAAAGLIVVGVEYRNAGGKLGPHAFPAGLNDCTSALDWLHHNRSALGVSNIVVSGESGGGNLTLATTLAAKRAGNIDQIDGVYAQCPYISGVYADPIDELPSLRENDEYFIGNQMLGIMARVYDPSGEHTTNPLAWPYHADVDDLAGLPPHVISVNELDPLRDEGLAYYRKLQAAGVPAVGRVVLGTCHAGDLLVERAAPDVFFASVRDLVGFATSL